MTNYRGDRKDQTFNYAGTDFELRQSFNLNVIGATLDKSWTEYQTELVSMSYGTYERSIKQDVLDALSPFQMVSKLWLTSLLVSRKIPHWGLLQDPTSYVLIGSWFGQAMAMLRSRTDCVGYLFERPITLIDKDPLASRLGIQLLEKQFTNASFVTDDVFNVEIPGTRNLFLWPGVEHFQEQDVMDHIAAHDKGNVWILQGTNMTDADHKNPINYVSQLLRYFHDGQVLYTGELKCNLGTRFMVACKT